MESNVSIILISVILQHQRCSVSLQICTTVQQQTFSCRINVHSSDERQHPDNSIHFKSQDLERINHSQESKYRNLHSG